MIVALVAIALSGRADGSRDAVVDCFAVERGRAAVPMKAGTLFIDDSELVLSFLRASGPCGRNIYTTATAVELRFSAARTRGARARKAASRRQADPFGSERRAA